MYFNDLFKKNLYIHILNFEKNNIYLLFGIHNILNYLSQFFDIFIYFYNDIDNFDKDILKLIIPKNISLNISIKDTKIKFKNNIYEENSFSQLDLLNKNNLKINNNSSLEKNILNQKMIESINKDSIFRIIDFHINKNLNLIDIYESIFSIPISIRYSKKYLNLNRLNELENDLYLFHLSKFNNFPYIFCSSFYHLKESNFAVFIYLFNFYKKNLDFENPFYKSWYYKEESFFYFGKIIENAEEIYIHIQDIEWFEFILNLNLSKIKKKILYYEKKDIIIIQNLKFYNPLLFDWQFIYLE